MKEIVQKWLFDCLGQSIKMENLGMEMKDGVLLARLLKQYQVVNEKTIKYIVPTDQPLACENNLRQLNIWFNLLGIKVDGDTFYDIAHGKTTTCLHILYELYLALHNKEKLYFVHTKKHIGYLRKSSKLSIHFLKCTTGSHEQLVKQQPLLSESETAKFCKLRTYAKNHAELSKMKERKKTSKTKIELACKTVNIENEKERMKNEDILFVRNNLNYFPSQQSDSLKENRLLTTDDIQLSAIEKEQRKKVFRRISDSFKGITKECENLIMNSVWKSIEMKETEQLKKMISHNLLNQAQYEKQTLSKTFQKRFQERANFEKFLETKQKIDKESGNLAFFSSCKTSEEEINSQLEMIKKIDNHRKLYAEKLRKRYRKHYAICLQIMYDIVDIAIKSSLIGKEYVSDEIWSQWKQMFVLEQPIWVLDENEDRRSTHFTIIERDEPTLYPAEHDFEEYLHLIGDWTEHSGSDMTFDEREVLGHIVQRLFGIKYPSPFIQKPAELTKHKVCATLNGINDESTIIKLKTLLIKSKISLVDVKSAVNFCIKCYKSEANIQEEPQTGKKGKKTATPKSKKSKPTDSKKGAGKKGTTQNLQEDKEVQTTSSLLVTHEIKELSNIAKMGKCLYELESLDNIPIPTIVEVLVEYLKFQSNINGWVLLNFPSTLNEAYIIEKTLSGKKFPQKFKQKTSNKTRDDTRNSRENFDEYNAKFSRIIQFPPNDFDSFKTYFTSFILVTQGIEELPDESASKQNSTESGSVEKVSLEKGSEILEDNAMAHLTAIYGEQDILHKFYYETMDLITLKKIARLIVKNIIPDEVASIELFGEESLKYLTKKPDLKVKKSPKKNKEDPEQEYEILKQTILLDENQSKLETHVDEKPQQLRDSEILIKPGHKDWIYNQFHIPQDMAITLANLWEEMEECYIYKIKEIFNRRRNEENLVSLYIDYIMQSMREYFEDHKESQKLLQEFLKKFNCIPKKIRSLEATQNELSSQVFHLEMKLWEITNEKKNKAEEKRGILINQNWTGDRIIQITNSYLSLLRVEIDRCISTITLIQNYYSLMSGSHVTDFLYITIALPETHLNANNSAEVQNVKFAIIKVLTDKSNINFNNPLYNIIDDIFKQCRTEINKLKSNLTTLIGNKEQQIFVKLKAHKKKLKTEEKKEVTPKKLEKDEYEIPVLAEENYIDIKNMFLEWSYAIQNECDRTKRRMEIIKSRMRSDTETLESNIATIFHNLYNQIEENYLKQNECIDKICKIIHTAINGSSPVICDLVFEGNYVYMEPDQFTDYPVQPFEEEISSQCFTIKQLKYISERLKIISTNGLIHKNALMYILQDLVFCEQERENIQLFPKMWNDINSIEFEKLFTIIYGFGELVNWKDLIIYALELQFPEMEDIINYKTQFNLFSKENEGIISYDDFMNIKLWFENFTENSDYNAHIKATKQFLFSLFQINETEMNYCEFILAFCKDINQKIGFGKGLAYFLGKCVIVSGKKLYLEDTLRDHREQQNNLVREILNQIVFDVVNTYAGLKIDELIESTGSTSTHNNTNQQSLNYVKPTADKESLLETIYNREDSKNIKKKEFDNIAYNKELPSEHSLISITETDKNISVDKASQTIPFPQLLYDEYIKINKVLQWTSEVPKPVINALLEAIVYPVLHSHSNKKETEDIIWKIKRTLTVIEDDFVYIPWLMDQNIMQDIFSYVHSFKIFSFPSIIKGLNEYPCT